MPGVARVGDVVVGYCNGPGHAANRDFTGTWLTGSPVVTADGLPVVRVGDTGITDCGHMFYAVTGVEIATSDGLLVHTIGCVCITEGDGVGTTVTGSDIVTTKD